MCVFRISASDHTLVYRYVLPPHLRRSDGDATSASVAWPAVQGPSALQDSTAQHMSVDHSASLLCIGGNTAVARQCLGDKPSSWYYDHSDTRSEFGAYKHHMDRCDRISHMDVHMAVVYHMLHDNGEWGPRRSFAGNIQVYQSTAFSHKDSQAQRRVTSGNVRAANLADDNFSGRSEHRSRKDGCRVLRN